MSKHSRDEGVDDDFPLQNSIKKLKLDCNRNFGPSVPLRDLFPEEPSNNRVQQHLEVSRESIEEKQLREMNQLLGSLHFMRLERQAERVRINISTPQSTSQYSDYSTTTDASMDLS